MLKNAPDKWTLRDAAHLLNRAGFGGAPRDIKTLHGMGRKKAVEWLLDADEAGAELPPPDWALDPEETLAKARRQFAANRAAMAEMTAEERDQERRKTNRQRQRDQRQRATELQLWWFTRMVKTQAPLREKMTLFWHDHFPSSHQKVRVALALYLQNSLFREHAFGNFKELTHKIAVDPAMMLYLDTPTSKKGKPNENFARELLELFTLGEGHYSEQDIKEAARAFTGYQLNRGTGKVFHNKFQWDRGEKTFLGQKGNFDGDGIIDVVFTQKQTSRYLPMKLWEFFAFENPSEGLVDALGETFAAANFEVKPLLRKILMSEEFYSDDAIRSQIKSPIQFLVQMLRQLELDEMPRAFVTKLQADLGQVLFFPPNVAGWDWGKAWINTNSLLTRYNIAGFVTKGTGAEAVMSGGNGRMANNPMMRQVVGRNWLGPDYDQIVPRELREDSAELIKLLSFRLFQTQLDERQTASFREYADAKRGVVFTNSEVAELVHLMMSTPYYQLT